MFSVIQPPKTRRTGEKQSNCSHFSSIIAEIQPKFGNQERYLSTLMMVVVTRRTKEMVKMVTQSPWKRGLGARAGT